jgi:hypothetical protein
VVGRLTSGAGFQDDSKTGLGSLERLVDVYRKPTPTMSRPESRRFSSLTSSIHPLTYCRAEPLPHRHRQIFNL